MNPAEEFEIRMTSDGSPTVYSKHYDATFHSSHGAIQESLHVFIKNGLHFLPDDVNEIRILEIGFGTGLNALLTLENCRKKIFYHSLEKHSLPKNIYEKLNYRKDKSSLIKLHNCDWEKDIEISPQFTIHKSKNDILGTIIEKNYHLIYFDAFAPSTQEELWHKEVLQKMFDCLVPGGILVTFCAKGEFKRLLKSIGFTVQSPKGAVGKREMTRALKQF